MARDADWWHLPVGFADGAAQALHRQLMSFLIWGACVLRHSLTTGTPPAAVYCWLPRLLVSSESVDLMLVRSHSELLALLVRHWPSEFRLVIDHDSDDQRTSG